MHSTQPIVCPRWPIVCLRTRADKIFFVLLPQKKDGNDTPKRNNTAPKNCQHHDRGDSPAGDGADGLRHHAADPLTTPWANPFEKTTNNNY